eukprot:1161529-Pelagomonas_calceolata.AAC.17
MVAARGAQEGTLGAPLIATGRRKEFWGPSHVATCTFVLSTKGSVKKGKNKKRGHASINLRLVP